jgi:cytochrome d ubiquinol oxidase subunit I
LLATGTWNGEVEGLNELQAADVQQYGAGNYVPNVFVQYWSMRVMAYLGSLITLLALWGAWLLYRKKLAESRVFLAVATWAVLAPFLMNTAGWMLTENGRQPWLVQGLMKTADGVSTSVGTAELAISIGALVVVYVLIGIVYLFLMLRYARRGLELEHDEPSGDPRTPAINY